MATCDENSIALHRRQSHFPASVHIAITLLLAISTVDANAQGVRGFGAPQGKLPLRGFGNPAGEEALRVAFPEAAAAVIGEDWAQAYAQIGKTDGNGDGKVTEEEWNASGYQRPSQFYYNDLNHDGVITAYEQTIGFAAWRRRNERRADANISRDRAARPKPEPAPSTAALQAVPTVDPQVEARQRQASDLATVVLRSYDINENGTVERSEFRSQTSQFGNLSSADADRDGEVNRNELSAWLLNRLPPLTSAQLALEFQVRDTDRDGQVSLREYTPGFNADAVSEFNRWDRNGDGLVTPTESQDRPKALAVEYAGNQRQVLKPNATIVSRMWIEDDVPIDDMTVYMSISKESDNYTEVHLLSPGGQRITLFEGGGSVPWGGGLILKDVTFTDKAPIVKQPLRSPPSVRAVAPPGVGDKKMLSLADLRGSRTRGAWRLVIGNQNDRAGILLNWSLRVTPGKEMRNGS